MAQAYSNPKRASDPHALPDIDVWKDKIFESECCDTDHNASYVEATAEQPCLSCGRQSVWRPTDRTGWFYWFCFPGCLPEGEAMGPFKTEEEALADAREGVEDQDGDEDQNQDEEESR